MSDERWFAVCREVCRFKNKECRNFYFDWEDLASEVYLKIKLKGYRWENVEKHDRFVDRIASNYLTDMKRKGQDTESAVDSVFENALGVEEIDDSDFALDMVCADLPGHYVEVLKLSKAGFTAGEGAKLLGLTVSNYKVRLHRARIMAKKMA